MRDGKISFLSDCFKNSAIIYTTMDRTPEGCRLCILCNICKVKSELGPP